MREITFTRHWPQKKKLSVCSIPPSCVSIWHYKYNKLFDTWLAASKFLLVCSLVNSERTNADQLNQPGRSTPWWIKMLRLAWRHSTSKNNLVEPVRLFTPAFSGVIGRLQRSVGDTGCRCLRSVAHQPSDSPAPFQRLRAAYRCLR